MFSDIFRNRYIIEIMFILKIFLIQIQCSYCYRIYIQFTHVETCRWDKLNIPGLHNKTQYVLSNDESQLVLYPIKTLGRVYRTLKCSTHPWISYITIQNRISKHKSDCKSASNSEKTSKSTFVRRSHEHSHCFDFNNPVTLGREKILPPKNITKCVLHK